MNSAYSATDSSDLYDIAILNPLTGGNAVYIARNILFLEVEPESSERRGKSIEVNVDVKEIKVYPNPTAAQITLLSNNDLSGYAYLIKDVSGRIIQKGTYEQHIKLNNIESGLYQIQLSNTAGSNYIAKFIIIKK